jgi:hypothetical protein
MPQNDANDLIGLRQEIEDLKSRISKIERQRPRWEVPLDTVDDLFVELFRNLSDSEISRLFRELETGDLARAVVGLDLKAMGRIKVNMSANAWQGFVEDIRFDSKTLPNSSWARQRILKTTMQLLETGEITSSDEFYIAMGGQQSEPLPVTTPPSDDELLQRQRKEAEKKNKYDRWLKTLDHIEIIKGNVPVVL